MSLTTPCDFIPQQNLEIPNMLLKKNTGQLIHTHFLNGSIVEFQLRKFLCYRSEQEPFCTNPRVHIVQLDNRMIPKPETNITLDLRATKQCWTVQYAGRCHRDYQYRAEDPRLCVVGNILYLFWGDGFKVYYTALTLSYKDGDLTSAMPMIQHIPKPPFVQELYDNSNYDGREKNWSPFSHKGKLHVIYCFEPFVTCQVDGPKCLNVKKHNVQYDWKWGFIKGGTPALQLDKDRYVTFFHSTIKTKNNEYYIGALTFSRNTLEPLEISRYPIVAPYPEADENQIVFPAGVIDRGDHFLISYGYNDKCIKLCAYLKQWLDYNLRPLETDQTLILDSDIPPLHTHVINLDRSPERLVSVKNQLQQWNQTWTRFSAVDGRNISVPDCRLSDLWDKMSNGQRGCSLSHVTLLNQMNRENWEYMFVLEDDIILCDDFMKHFSEYWNMQMHKDSGFDLIYVGNQCVPVRDGIGVRNVPTFCTHALIWSLKGAKKMLEIIERDGLYVIDIMMIDAHKAGQLNAYSWIKTKTDHEKTLNLWHNRSSGLVFQSKDFVETIHD